MSGFPQILQLSSLLPEQGFKIFGEEAFDYLSLDVSLVSDVNGDGVSDIFVSSRRGDGVTFSDVGAAYVVYGGVSQRSDIDISSLSIDEGFAIRGTTSEGFGTSVSGIGDINNDGIGDLILGAPTYSIGPSSLDPGRAYVIYGQQDTRQDLDLSRFSLSEGFTVFGQSDERLGESVSFAGDINNDGIDDFTIGAPFASETAPLAGRGYIIYGRDGNFADLRTGEITSSQGVTIEGIARADLAGEAVSSAGDFNGDGFEDLLIGATGSDSSGTASGEAYIVYGGSDLAGTIELGSLSASTGVVLQSNQADQRIGNSVAAAGDVNGDGFDDLIVGAESGKIGGKGAGQAYIVFGRALPGATIDFSSLGESPDSGGFIAYGAPTTTGLFGDWAGASVAAAGDINADGFDDVVIGAPFRGDTGGAYVVFGKANGWESINLPNLSASDGFFIAGEALAGGNVSGGDDLNGDGIDDLIVDDVRYPTFDQSLGSATVIYGQLPTVAVVRTGSDIDQTIRGGAFSDRLQGLGGDDVLVGNAGDDIIEGGDGIDTAIYRGVRSEYAVNQEGSSENRLISDANSDRDGSDTLSSIERILFEDGAYIFDVTGAFADYTYALYAASLTRTPDEAGFRFWNDIMNSGVFDQSTRQETEVRLAEEFVESDEFNQRFDVGTTHGFITALYQNVLGRAPDRAGFDFWTGIFDTGEQGRDDMLRYFAVSDENMDRIADDIEAGFWVL